MAGTGGKIENSEFTAESYFAAAKEHAGSLLPLYDARQYAWTLCASGVAVESMLRAYRCRLNAEFDSRHDLHELAKDARFAQYVPEAIHDKYAADPSLVALRGTNNHRYRSEEMIRRRFKRAKLDRGIKGDYLKENARVAVNAAIAVVQLGDQLWKTSLSS